MISITLEGSHLEAVVHDYRGIDLVRLGDVIMNLPIMTGTSTVMLHWMPKVGH